MADFTLTDFMRESLEIEGILRDPFDAELTALNNFIHRIAPPTIMACTELCQVFQHNAVLRDKPGLDVRVGNHIPCRGGPEVTEYLEWMLTNSHKISAYRLYAGFQYLHPYTDGNGRTGRALWLWRTGGHPQSFLKAFHFQTLADCDKQMNEIRETEVVNVIANLTMPGPSDAIN